MPRPKPAPLPYLNECPRLSRVTLSRVGGLAPGRVTYWRWQIASAPSITVTAAPGAFTIDDGERTTRVVAGKCLTCPGPGCGAMCQYLVFVGEWRCRRCSSCIYRHRPDPWVSRQAVLRQLSRVDPLSLRAFELERKLRRVNRAIAKRARYVGNRISSGRRGRGAGGPRS
jgi:hypothetical protein